MEVLRFTESAPDMRPDDPVHCLWSVIYYDTPMSSYGLGVQRDKKIRAETFETIENAQERAALLHRYNYHVVAIAPTMFQDGDYIENFDPDLPKKKREERERQLKEQQQRDGQIDRSFVYPGDRITMVNPRVSSLPSFAGSSQDLRHIDHFFNVAFPEPEQAVRIKEGDGIEAAVEAKKGRPKPFHARIAEGFRRSAGLRSQASIRHSAPPGKGRR